MQLFEDMNFIFSYGKQCFTHSLRSGALEREKGKVGGGGLLGLGFGLGLGLRFI